MPAPSDPFRDNREKSGVLRCPFHGEELVLLLRHDDVRRAAKDWRTYSSDAPFRVPVPSEEAVRSVRQLPIETDPPDHTDYRALVEPFFQRAKDPAVVARVEALIARMLDEAAQRGTVEVVHEFALPVQAHALALLLDVPESEARTWISWGLHVFKVTGGPFKKGTVLEEYLHAQLDRAEAQPGGADFFGALARAAFRGRRLTRGEMIGFGNLTFAGGRDTIIQTITCALAFLAENPRALDYLRSDPDRITLAGEELFRVFTPLTQIGRVCPGGAEVHGQAVGPGERISLCWAAANLDEKAFPAPLEVRLDRKPNPHLAFGHGPHLCLGAPHARLILRTLLRLCAERVGEIRVLTAEPHVEREAAYHRVNGYASLHARIVRR